MVWADRRGRHPQPGDGEVRARAGAHTADFDPGGAIIILPALLVFPVGYVLLGRLLARQGARWSGLLVGVGAVVYWSGSIPLFAVAPRSPLIQLLEVAGAVPFAIGFVLLGRRGTGPEPAQ